MSSKNGFLPTIAAIASLMIATSGCLLVDTDGNANDGGGQASGGGSSEGGTPSTGNGGADEGGGGTTPGGNGVGPSGDLAPDASEPGAYACAGCPEAMMDTTDVDAGTETTFDIAGKVADQSGQGQFLVISESGQFAGGGVRVDPDSGDFEQTVPLFCGVSLLKVYFTNDAGTSAFVKRIENSGCLPDDVRVTIAWDETTAQWSNHLVRFGGTIYDNNVDCHSPVTCYLGSNSTDWGVADSSSDDPVMDTDAFHDFLGVENIYYPNAEDGLTVLIENGGTVYGLTPSATLYINVHDQPTYVKQIAVLHPMEVLIAAEIDGAAGAMTVVDEIYDCASEYNLSCEADIP